MTSPCKNCKDRTVTHQEGQVMTCHSTCERYAEYVKEREVIRKARQDENNAHSEHKKKYGFKYMRKWDF